VTDWAAKVHRPPEAVDTVFKTNILVCSVLPIIPGPCGRNKAVWKHLLRETRHLTENKRGVGNKNDRGKLARPIEGRRNPATSTLGTDVTLDYLRASRSETDDIHLQPRERRGGK
jgi:hypothetical protein